MDPPAPAKPAPPQALNCLACGYALAGLQDEDRCPECGLAIEISRRGDALAHADPAWLDRLHRGLRLLGIACIVAVSIVPAFFGLLVLFILVPDAPEAIIRVVFEVVAGIALVVAFVYAFVGWRHIAAPEPRAARPILREPERIAILTSLGVMLLGIVVVSLLGVLSPAAGSVANLFGRINLAVFLGFGAVHVIVAMLPFARLARRLGKPKHQKSFRRAMFYGLVGFPIVAFSSLTGSPLSRMVMGAGGGLMTIVALPVALVDLFAHLTVFIVPLTYPYAVWLLWGQIRSLRQSQAGQATS